MFFAQQRPNELAWHITLFRLIKQISQYVQDTTGDTRFLEWFRY